MLQKAINKYQNMSASVRTSLWFTFCNFFQRGTAIIFVPIFTRLLTTKQYGLYNVYLSWFEVFVIFASLKLPYEGLNNGLIRHEEDKDGYTSAIASLMFFMTMIWFVVYLIFHRFIDAFSGLSTFVMCFMFFEVLFNPPLYLWTNRERFDTRYRWPVLVTLVYTILNPVIAIIAVMHTAYKAEARIIATASLQGILGLILFIYLLKKGKKIYDKAYWMFALSFNLPLIFYYLSQTLLSQCDRIMINYYTGTGDAGIYSVAYSAATLVLLVVSAINGSFNPWMYKKIKNKEYEDVGRYSFQIFVLLAVTVALMMAFAPDLIKILATKEYYQAIYVIPPVAASVYFTFVYMVFANVEMYLGETGWVAIISIISGLSNVILNAIFIPKFGYFAAGWTTVASYILLAVLHFAIMKKSCKKNGIERALFYEKRIFLLSGGMMIFAFVMTIIYRFGYLRYMIFFISFILAIIFKDQLMKLYTNMKR